MKHAWGEGGRCTRCDLRRRFCQSRSKRARDRGALVRFVEVREGEKGPWQKIPGGHALPGCTPAPERWIARQAAMHEATNRARARAKPRPKGATPAPERAVAAGGHIKKCLSIDWWTPPELIERVRALLGGVIPLDPFTAPSNPTGASRFYTLRENGLLQPWDAPWFANPPYGRALRAALAKITREAGAYHGGGAPLAGVALLPCSRWEQGYMHELLRVASVVCYVRKRIKFVKAKTGDRVGGTPMASMFLGFNVDEDAFGALFRDVGLCLRTSEI